MALAIVSTFAAHQGLAKNSTSTANKTTNKKHRTRARRPRPSHY